MKNRIAFIFLGTALVALIIGSAFGTIGAFQFVFPNLFKNSLPFFKTRPLHVSLVVSWIFLAVIGGIYHYLPMKVQKPLFSGSLAVIHYWLFFITGIVILTSYLMGKFGGREYWAFPPIFSICIIISWLFFAINFFGTAIKHKGKWPVYLWMWATGVIFFLITFTEAHLWVFDYFKGNFVRDITVQWKAYGSLVGSWNMLVYGTAIYVMSRTSKDDKMPFSKTVFFLYFIGLINLMFGWSHHIYVVPAAKWIRHLGYAISMTELIVLGHMIWRWKNTMKEAQKLFYILPYRFLLIADVWIFLNLLLAISISIPAIHVYTHGTHNTVAHAMGSSIGINTMILLASIFLIFTERFENVLHRFKRSINVGFWILNISLFLFWLALIGAGIGKAYLINTNENMIFQDMMTAITPYFVIIAVTGVGMFAGMVLIVKPLMKISLEDFL